MSAADHDDEVRELYEALVLKLGERTAKLLMKRVMALEDPDWATSADLTDLTEAVMARFEQVDARFEQVDARFEQVDARFEQVDARFEQVDARFEQVDARFEQVDARFEQLGGRLEEGLAHMAERITMRREADDARFEMLAMRVDGGFDRLRAELRGELLTAVTTQTRTLVFALVGSFALYAGMTLTLLR
jgi:predicted ATPase